MAWSQLDFRDLGALHGMYQIFGIITKSQRNTIVQKIGLTQHPQLYKWVQVLTVFFLVCFSWIFFRANTINDAFYIVGQCFSVLTNPGQVFALNWSHDVFMEQGAKIFGTSIIAIAIMETVHLIQRNGSVSQLLGQRPAIVRWGVYYLAIIAVLLFGQFGNQEFIYFQF
ncbi:hypothetical protein GCM10028895_01500 [Pontibacter rugosus]